MRESNIEKDREKITVWLTKENGRKKKQKERKRIENENFF